MSRCTDTRKRGSGDRHFPGVRARAVLARQQSLQLRDIGGRFIRRQVCPDDLFSLGKTALQADHQRQIGAHARIGGARP